MINCTCECFWFCRFVSQLQPVTQTQDLTTKEGDGYYEGGATLPNEDHACQSSEAASNRDLNKAIQEADYSHFDDFDSPNERVSHYYLTLIG